MFFWVGRVVTHKLGLFMGVMNTLLIPYHALIQVRVWSRTHAHAQKFAQEIHAKLCSTAEEAVRDADVICTVTFATTPILQASWVKPGAHING